MLIFNFLSFFNKPCENEFEKNFKTICLASESLKSTQITSQHSLKYV